MATLNQVNADDYDFATNASNSAQQARDTYEQQLNNELMQYLDKAYQSQQEAQELRKQSALDAITRQVRDTQEQYQTDVQNNYAQKIIAQNQAASDIAEAGVAGTGFDSSNMIGVRNQYAANYNELTKQKNKDIRAIGEKEIDTINEYNAQAKELESDYNKNVLSQKQYINEQAENKYNNVYQQEYNSARQAKIDYDNAQQQAYENYWNEKKYEDDMAYREWQKQMQEKQYQLDLLSAKSQASYYNSLAKQNNDVQVTETGNNNKKNEAKKEQKSSSIKDTLTNFGKTVVKVLDSFF